MLVVPILMWFLSLPLGHSALYISALAIIVLWQMVNFYSGLLVPFYSGLFVRLEDLNGSLVMLSIWVTLLMFLVSMKDDMFFGFLVGSLLGVVVLFFLVDHMVLFYILFEVSLLPTLFLILKWGYQPERLQASTYFMMYTICASLPLLVAILKLYGDTGYLGLYSNSPLPVLSLSLSSYSVYVCFLLAFLVKVPMWGVHLWLPKAHVEAPVSGSMILAGVLLKLGGYGLMKIYLLVFEVMTNVVFIFLAISLWGGSAVSMVCMRQTDVKSLIAYSSVIHMALMVLGILSGTWSGAIGATMMMVAHGLSSPGLFALANFNFVSVGTRNLLMYKGLSLLFPASGLLWFLLLMANMAAPPSLNLAAELLIVGSVLKLSWWTGIFLGLCTFMAAGYNLYLYNCQQGKPSHVPYPSQVWSSVTFLMGILHIIPVYGLIWSLASF